MKRLSFTALFIALSVIGAAIKIPGPVGSVALDVFPALVASVLMGGPAGAVTAAFGHLLSAWMGGLPLGPFHIMIAAEMALLVWMFSLLYQIGRRKTAAALFVLGNAFAAPLPFLWTAGAALYYGVIPSLFVGALLNTALSLLLIPRLAAIIRPECAEGRGQR